MPKTNDSNNSCVKWKTLKMIAKIGTVLIGVVMALVVYIWQDHLSAKESRDTTQTNRIGAVEKTQDSVLVEFRLYKQESKRNYKDTKQILKSNARVSDEILRRLGATEGQIENLRTEHSDSVEDSS